MNTTEQEAKKLEFTLCQLMIESIAWDSKKNTINCFDELSQSAQREIAWAWLEWKITKTDDAAYFIDLLSDTCGTLNLISSLIRSVEFNIDDDLADKIIQGYKAEIESIFDNQLKVAA